VARWGELFPWPFVGVTVLLAVLVVLTPNLLSAGGGPSAGSLESQAELVLDRDTASGTTTFYIHGIGLVRYATIRIDLASAGWPAESAPRNWTTAVWQNLSLAAVEPTKLNPVGVNITVRYVDPTGQAAWFLGEYVVYATADTLYVDPFLPGSSAIAPTGVGALPLTLFLTQSSTGTVP